MTDRVYSFRTLRKTYEIHAAADDNCDFLFEEVFGRKVYATLPCLQDANTILDIGANIGCAAIWFHHFYRKANIYCYEPSPTSFKYLKRNTRGISRIHPFNFGLYSRDTTANIYSGIHTNSTNSLFSSVHNTASAQSITLRKASHAVSELELEGIDILKIDTEGAELIILHELKRYLNKVSAVYLEYHSEQDRREIAQLLEPRFTLYACNATHPHRGTLVYLATRLVSDKTDWDSFIIQRKDL